jgi:hypothetical protein
MKKSSVQKVEPVVTDQAVLDTANRHERAVGMELATLQQEREFDNQQVALQTEKDSAIAQCYKVIGQVQTSNMFAAFADVSSFVWLKDVKEKKLYKGIPGVGTWDKFCDSVGMSRQHVDDKLLNLATLGEKFLLTCQQLSVGYRELRKLRQLTLDGTIAVSIDCLTIGEEVIPIPGTGSHDYDLPDGWVRDFSSFESIEYPVGSIPELFLDSRDFKLYLTPSGSRLRVLSATPDETEIMRAAFTVPNTEATLPDQDTDAVANLAAANCLRRLAAASGQTSDPTIQADVVNYRSKADEFRRLADAFEQQYNDHLGIGKDAPVSAACAIASEPDNGPVGLVHLNSRVRMTHGRRS